MSEKIRIRFGDKRKCTILDDGFSLGNNGFSMGGKMNKNKEKDVTRPIHHYIVEKNTEAIRFIPIDEDGDRFNDFVNLTFQIELKIWNAIIKEIKKEIKEE